MADYIDRDEVIALIGEKQKMLCPAGRFSRQYVYGSDRATFDDWQKFIESINELSHIEVEESNEPLTLEELRGMDGEPVWNETMMKWQLVDMLGEYGPRAVDARGHWRELEADRYYRRKPEVNNED